MTKLLKTQARKAQKKTHSKRIKFHNDEINLPNKMNPLFRLVELEKKESEMVQTFCFSLYLFLVYGVKMSIILVMHIFIHFQLSQKKSLGFK